MKKLLLILLCLPFIGIASFPTVTDSTENTRTTVSLNSDFNQKTDYKADITKIILEKDDPWRYIRWTLVIVASPERFLRKQSEYILSQPIKGTRKKGLNKLEDADLVIDLKESSKDISENVMITDLVRNDLSILAKKSSVKVEEFCQVYTFKQVHQLITSISAEIDNGLHFSDVLKAVFPMGSMTGAPKIRAMELIEHFESFKRGVFSGAIGYITPDSNFDFNVVIRTILYNLADQYLSIGVGGAITINSDPIEEYDECLVKAKPLFEVLNFSIYD